MTFDELTPEQKAKAMGCTSPEELLAVVREEGYELSDEELEQVTGGLSWDCFKDCDLADLVSSLPH
mgnify:CR=1 FL=1